MTKSETFTTSDGLTVDKTFYGLRVGGHSLGEETTRVLREFFRHERDEELGRWRWPENPEYVVYPKKADLYTVLHEPTGIAGKRSGDTFGDAANRAARAYSEACPEPKPWHEAKPGEVWEVESSVKDGNTWVLDSGAFMFDNEIWIGPDNIKFARRIWPEVADSSESH